MHNQRTLPASYWSVSDIFQTTWSAANRCVREHVPNNRGEVLVKDKDTFPAHYAVETMSRSSGKAPSLILRGRYTLER